MRTFKDNADHEWTVAVNVTSVSRVKDLLGVDLLALGEQSVKAEDQLICRLISDPVLLCNVIYCIVKPDADKAGISDEEFGRAMAGDAIDHATKALLEEIVNFFPNRRHRERAARVLETTWAMIDKAQDLMDTRLDKGHLEAEMAKALSEFGDSFGNGPESSASTPDP